MRKIVDYKHRFIGRVNNIAGVCRVRLFRHDATQQVVGVCSHLVENRYSPCLSKNLPAIVQQVESKYESAINKQHILWLEHHPADIGPVYGEDIVDLVSETDAAMPLWQRLDEGQLEKVTGLTFKHFRC
ncbi:hypothetical protein [Thaumasiovibrio sp. DFM-14]|uniref:hypothetical protein n=1 Tax=Thaumasiovibrio sp. DFM-14 TaxID=3384792 RepID=UPI0039A1CEA6